MQWGGMEWNISNIDSTLLMVNIKYCFMKFEFLAYTCSGRQFKIYSLL